MAYRPSLLPLLKKFGLDPQSFSSFLLCSHGFVAGGAAATAFFGKKLDSSQDLDIWIPLPVTLNHKSSYTAKERWDTASYCSLIQNTVTQFFTRNQKGPSASNLLSMSLEQIARKYRGVYRHITTTDVAEYTQSTLAPLVKSIVTFENPWTSRRIQVIFTYDVTLNDVLASFDLDVCKFYADGTNSFAIKHNHSASTLHSLRMGKATIIGDSVLLTEYQRARLETRVAKYEARGFTFTWAVTGRPWNEQFAIPDAPHESFYQDFILTTHDFTSNPSHAELRDCIRELFRAAECDFKGSDMEGNLDIMVPWMKARLSTDYKDGDNWQYTWRFTWDAERNEENVFICHMLLLNPY